jgi:hypothetical protein
MVLQKNVPLHGHPRPFFQGPVKFGHGSAHQPYSKSNCFSASRGIGTRLAFIDFADGSGYDV